MKSIGTAFENGSIKIPKKNIIVKTPKDTIVNKNVITEIL